MTTTETLEAPVPAPTTVIEPEVRTEALRPEIAKVLPPMPETADTNPLHARFLAGVRRVAGRIIGPKPYEVSSNAAEAITTESEVAEVPTNRADTPVERANPLEFKGRNERHQTLMKAALAKQATEAVVTSPETAPAEQSTPEAEADVIHLPSSGLTKSGLTKRVRGNASEFVALGGPEEAATIPDEKPELTLVETPTEATETAEVTKTPPAEPTIGKRRRLDVEVDAPSQADSEINARTHALGVPEGATGRHRGLQGAPYDAEGKLNNYPEFPAGGTHKIGVLSKAGAEFVPAGPTELTPLHHAGITPVVTHQ